MNNWLVFTLILMFGLHYYADFRVQTDWQARNKSKNWRALLTHTGTYSLFFLLFGPRFALVTFLCHTTTDYITSRWSARRWKDVADSGYTTGAHEFFEVIGFDQLLHQTQLLLTFYWLVA